MSRPAMNELLRSRDFASPSSMVARASVYCPRPIWLKQMKAPAISSDRPSLISRDGAAELAAPVRVRPEPREADRHRVREAAGSRDSQGLLEEPVSLRHGAVRL